MNEDIKRQWVEALRSGKYKQGRDRLHRGDRYCCLGVLCELAVEAGVVDRRESRSYGISSYKYGVDGDPTWSFQSTYLPHAVTEWAGLNCGDPFFDGESLSGLNDEGKPFTVIADLIERNKERV